MPYDGVLARVTKPMAAAAKTLRMPLVNTWLNSPVRDLPGVFPDFEAAGRLIAEHLLSRGFRRFGGLVPRRRDKAERAMMKAFRSVIEEAGYSLQLMSHHPDWMNGSSRWAETLEGLDAWLDNMVPPVALFVLHPRLAR